MMASALELTPALEARRFLRRTHSGVLSTHSARFVGYPFGSVVPFILDHDGQPLILISTLAEHTKNIAANPKVSLIVFEANQSDWQAGARLTLMGTASITDKQDGSLRARYLSYFPQAEQYFDMHDFLFHRIQVEQVRYIGGFGKIHWIASSEMAVPVNSLAEQEPAIVAHMNEDHWHSLVAYCRYVHGQAVTDVRMLGLDSDGFDVLADGKTLRFDFEAPVIDAQSARLSLVALSKAATL